MVFAEATDERSLSAFENDSEAIAYCEGIDVTEGNWLFWDDSGNPLEPVFSTPTMRGRFVVSSGTYTLQRSTSIRYAHLMEVLDSIRTYDAGAPFDCKEGVLAHISKSAPL
jgi:hypothetical protein